MMIEKNAVTRAARFVLGLEGRVTTLSYTAYGYLRSGASAIHLGFNGQVFCHDTGGYALGNGYRIYSPTLMRFQAPDELSPFEAGGLNSYSYVANDPVNQQDPTGRVPQWSVFGSRKLTSRSTPGRRLIATSREWDVENQLPQRGHPGPQPISGHPRTAIWYEDESRPQPFRSVQKASPLERLLLQRSPATDALLQKLPIADLKNLGGSSRTTASSVVHYLTRSGASPQLFHLAHQLAFEPSLKSRVELAGQRLLMKTEPELSRTPQQAVEQIRQDIV